MESEIKTQLEKIAYKKSIPFCYHCYQSCPTSKCESCGSDDLMRLLPGSGCEYGLDWIITSILEENLEPVNLDDEFESFVRECYPEESKIGWMNLDTVSVLKSMDPISWKCAQSDWESNEADDGSIISFDSGSTYYWRNDVETFIEAEA